MAAFGVTTPLAVIHAQSTATSDLREADRSWAKYKGWTQPIGEAQEKWGKLTNDDEEGERQVGDFETRGP
jgi:hypothetical protein